MCINLNNKYVNGNFNIIDMSWYAPYKEFGDNIICMFAYISFIWHMFKSVSNFINGTSDSASTVGKVEGGNSNG